MKYVVLIGDGMAGRPLRVLGGRTCLQKADTPAMDALAQRGQVGWAKTIPPGYDPGSDVANLAILGYDPARYYTGRAPVEAEYQGIKLGPSDIAYRCNVVNLKFSGDAEIASSVMNDYSAGHITTPEARRLIRYIDKKLGSRDISFFPGVSYRHLMVWKKGREKIRCIPPHDITGRHVREYLPAGNGSRVLMDLMQQSVSLLSDHPVNRSRIAGGRPAANSVWLWGQGRRLKVPAFRSKFGISGSLISAVDLTKGLGKCAGFDVINVKGSTGYIDTNYAGKASAALRALKKSDLVYVHVEAPDEAGHNGSIKDKIQAIEDFDAKVVSPVVSGLKKFSEYRILLMPDHRTPISVKTHTYDPVPFIIFSGGDETAAGKSGARSYSENICRMKGALKFEKGYMLMEYFLKSGDDHVAR